MRAMPDAARGSSDRLTDVTGDWLVDAACGEAKVDEDARSVEDGGAEAAGAGE